jgi:hypothetical protein
MASKQAFVVVLCQAVNHFFPSGVHIMPLRPLVVLACCLLLAACNKINQANYSKLEAGMAKAEVETLLGSPSECAGALGVLSCTWGTQERFISVQYAGDKVLMFSGKGLQ